MQVEVNEENIVKYNLVQLTGNSKEDLLKAAKEAEESGYTLTCRIPDVADDLLQMNIFDAVEGREVTDEEIEEFYHEAGPITTYKKDPNVQPGPVINVEVVEGEVTESHIEEE